MSNDINIKGVTKRGENTYRFTASNGSDIAGKSIRHTMTFKIPAGTSPRKAEKMVMEAYTDFSRKCKSLPTIDENMRFSELVEKYMQLYAPNELKPVTMYNYEKNLLTHIIPVFGNRKISSITTAELTKFFTHLDLASETTRKLKTIVSSVMTFGVKQGYIEHNPCRDALYKKDPSKTKKLKYLDQEQSRKLMALTLEYSIFNTIIQILIFTGLRIGECLCLQWHNVDFEHGTISIYETLAYAYRKKYQSSTKNNQSVRTLKLGEYSIALLKRHKKSKTN